MVSALSTGVYSRSGARSRAPGSKEGRILPPAPRAVNGTPLFQLETAVRAGAARQGGRRAAGRAGRIAGLGRRDGGVVGGHGPLSKGHLTPLVLQEAGDARAVFGTSQE